MSLDRFRQFSADEFVSRCAKIGDVRSRWKGLRSAIFSDLRKCSSLPNLVVDRSLTAPLKGPNGNHVADFCVESDRFACRMALAAERGVGGCFAWGSRVFRRERSKHREARRIR